MIRPRTIGASDVPTILGSLGVPGMLVYRDQSAYALWAHLTGQAELVSRDTPATERGHMIEPGALLRLADGYGLRVMPNSAQWSPADEMPRWRHATPDGFMFPASDISTLPSPIGVAEVKALRFLDGWGAPGGSEVAVHVAAQVAWQMACTNAPRAWVGAWGSYRDDWRTYVVDRDLRLEARLENQVGAWWDRHVLGLEPPPLDDTPRAAQALSRMYAEVTDTPLEATTADRDMVARLRTLDEHLADVRSRRRQMRNRLQARIGEHTRLTHGGETLARLSQPSRSDGARRLTVIQPEIHDVD